MAVQPQTPYKESLGNGVTTVFPLEFSCENKDHLIVKIDDVEVDSSIWSLANDQVTFATAPLVDKVIAFQRNTPFQRTRDYQSYDNSFRPAPVNKDFDWVWLKLQELGYRDQVIWLALLKEIADRIDADSNLQNQINAADSWLQNLQQQVDFNTSDIEQLVTDLSKEIADRITGDQFLKDLFLSMMDEAINEGTINALAVTHVDSIEDIENIGNVWDRRTVYVKDLGNYRYSSATSSWIRVFQDANSVRDESGKTQQEVNNASAKIYTPEMFVPSGVKPEDVTDWSPILETMFQTLAPYPTGDNIPFSDIQYIYQPLTSQQVIPKKVFLSRKYRHTKTVYIPGGIDIEQASTSHWGTIGFFYDPAPSDYNTAGVSTVVYTANNTANPTAGTFRLNTDIMYLPTGSDFDTGRFVPNAWHINLNKVSFESNPNVTLGVRLLGFFGATDKIWVGTRAWGRYAPKVGVLMWNGWCTTHYKPRVYAQIQAWVNGGSSANTAIYSPYLSRGGILAESGVNLATTNTVPIYTKPSITIGGSHSLTVLDGEVTAYSPTFESSHIAVCVANSRHVSLVYPHGESTCQKHFVYAISSKVEILCKDRLSVPFDVINYSDQFKDTDGTIVSYPISAIYVQDYTEVTRDVTITGDINYTSNRLVLGLNCPQPPVVLNVSRGLYYLRKIGNVNLIRKSDTIGSFFKTIYIDPVNGNDESLGLRDVYPRKTLKDIKHMLDDFGGIRNVNIISDLTLTENITLPKNTFMSIATGKTLNLASFYFTSQSNTLDGDFRPTNLTTSGGTITSSSGSRFVYLTGGGILNLNIRSTVLNMTGCALIQDAGSSVANVNINTSSLIAQQLIWNYASGHNSLVTLNSSGASVSFSGRLFDGNATVLNAGVYSKGSLAITSVSVPANSSVTYTVTVPSSRVGDSISASYSAALAGLIMQAEVTANNTVTVRFSNPTTAALNLAAGTLYVKAA